ncbi:MAG: hypothetical protein M1820_003383 [Bogoriella megaspora]|nr:MAG: hypothetical protein M1820_003383 [Bogoriella megaspora]
MSTLLRRVAQATPATPKHVLPVSSRTVSTLSNNPHIYIHPQTSSNSQHTLTLLPTEPPNPHLAIGTSTTNPPTPSSFTENPHFLTVLHSVLRDHAPSDPQVQSQAQAYASTAGSSLGSGGSFFPQQHQSQSTPSPAQSRQPRKAKGYGGGAAARHGGPGYGGGGGAGGGGAGGASAQGGAGGGGVGGYIHVSDMRNPPDFGRIAWPEDIFGSLEVDAQGQFVEPRGRYQESGTYRICTKEGM